GPALSSGCTASKSGFVRGTDGSQAGGGSSAIGGSSPGSLPGATPVIGGASETIGGSSSPAAGDEQATRRPRSEASASLFMRASECQTDTRSATQRRSKLREGDRRIQPISVAFGEQPFAQS